MAAIDISQLPLPEVIETLDFETIFAARKAAFVALFPEDEQAAVLRTLALESEPVTKMLQENAYRELILRQRINEAAVAGMVLFSAGADLDNLAANNDVSRLVVTAADDTAVPPVAAVMESDDDLRLRIPEAFEGLSVAGPKGAYEARARAADGRVMDVSAVSPAPAEVLLTVLSAESTGEASAALLTLVEAAVNDEDVRPVADRVTVQSAVITDYQVTARLHLFDGVAAAPCQAAAQAALAGYIQSQRRLGRSIRPGSYAAVMRVAGVDWVEMVSPAADVILDETQAGNCTGYSVEVAQDG